MQISRRSKMTCDPCAASAALPFVLLASVAVHHAGASQMGEVDGEAAQSQMIQNMVDAHMTTLGLVRELQARIETAFLSPGITTRRQQTWARDIFRERVIEVSAIRLADGRIAHNSFDTLIDRRAERVRTLTATHYDGDAGQRERITHIDQAGFNGAEMALEHYENPDILGQTFLLSFSLVLPETPKDLASIAAAYSGLSCIGKTAVDGVECVHLRFTHPGVNGKYANSVVDMFLDPAHGFLMRKMVKHLREEGRSTELTRVVRDFYTAEAGVCFPRTAESYASNEEGVITSHQIATMSECRVNDECDGDWLEFMFPKNLFVTVLDAPMAASVGENDVLLIGENGQIVRTFQAGSGEFHDFMEDALRAHLLSKQGDEATGKWARLVIVLVGALCMSAAILWCVWRMARNRPPPA